MSSPNHFKYRSQTPTSHHLDWDSPSNKTGTVKRRPTSCGDTNQLTLAPSKLHFLDSTPWDVQHPHMATNVEEDIGNILSRERKSSMDANNLGMGEDRLDEACSLNYNDNDSIKTVIFNPTIKPDEQEVTFDDEVLCIEISEADQQQNNYTLVPKETVSTNIKTVKQQTSGIYSNVDSIYSNVCVESSRRFSLFCDEVSEKDHKFLVDKCGKIIPNSATLFSPEDDAPGPDFEKVNTKSVLSKLKPPGIIPKLGNSKLYGGVKTVLVPKQENISIKCANTTETVTENEIIKNAANEMDSVNGTSKRIIPKMKLNLATTKTNDKSKFKIFSTKAALSNIKESKFAALTKEPLKPVVGNNYVKMKFGAKPKQYTAKSPVTRLPSKLPRTPIENDNVNIHLSPNKKYTVTSQHGIRYDKDNYVVFDPQSGFDDGSGKKIPKYHNRIDRREIEDNPIYFESPSDTDSGIISPMSPFESGSEVERRNSRTSPQYGRLKVPSNYSRNQYGAVKMLNDFAVINDESATSLDYVAVKDTEDKITEQIKIYTDWANHYLERGRSAKRVRRLAECGDGEVLRDLLEAVTGQRVPVLRQYDNVAACLHFLHTQRVQGLEQVTADDVREGKLKAILALFFALSRHKQATKQQQKQSSLLTHQQQNQQQHQLLQYGVGKTGDVNCVNRMTGGAACEDLISAANVNMVQNRQASKASAAPGTAIPLPRRSRPLPPTPGSNNGGRGGGGSAVSASSSRSSSPGGNPRILGQHGTLPLSNNHGSRPNSSLIAPGSKIPSSPYATQPASPGPPAPPPHHHQIQQQNATKHSMLDKFKLFKDKSPNDRQKTNPNISKRTSSSSGFSSAKSERSDSSLSLNESTNIQSTHIKGLNALSKQIQQTDVSLGRDNQKISSKGVKSKLTTKSPKEITGNGGKPQKCEKLSKNSPKMQVKEKESKIAPPKPGGNNKPALIEDSVKSSKISMKPQDTKISRLSGSQMKLCADPRIPNSNSDINKMSPTEGKTMSIPTPKVNAACNGLPNSNSNASFASNPSLAGQPPNSTGIPKPTAAVKGTSKIPKDEKTNLSISKSTSASMSPSQSNSTLMTNSASALPFNRELSSLTKENCQKQTLVVSPMPNAHSDIQTLPAVAANPILSSQMSESSNSNSTHSASTGPHSNSSEGSVIYRPSSESGSEMSKARHNPIIPNRKIDTNAQYITEIIPEAPLMIKNETKRKIFEDGLNLEKNNELNVMINNRERKISRDSMDRNLDRARNCDSPSHGRDNSLGDDDNPSMNVLPMRPLLRGYNSHLTLPARSSATVAAGKNGPSGYPHHANTVKANFGRENVNLNVTYPIRERINGPFVGYANSDYCDIDIAAGYMSEGECLRRMGGTEMEKERERVRARAGDILDGYMSEGGASLYARRMQGYQPAPTIQQYDDRCRSSSQRMINNPHQNVHNLPGGPGGVILMQGVGVGGGPPVPTMDQQMRAAASRAKKSDSGQQTDTTGYKILSSNGHQSAKNGDNQWKKYTDSPGVGSPVQGGPPLSPLAGRKRTPGSQGSGQRGKPPGERLTAAQQLQTTAPPPQMYALSPVPHASSKVGPGGQLQSPGSASSQCSSRSSNAGPCQGNGSSGGSGSGRVKGVPQSFGYVKRAGGTAQPNTNGQSSQQMGKGQMQGGRTAQVSAVPRTKVKVSGGTQTCTQDLQIHKGGAGVKSFSLSGSAASQLSQSVRERLMMGSQSLPKPGSHDFAVLFQHHRVPPRGGMKISDGSLSDTQTYSDVKSDYGSPYTSWLRHSNTYSASGRLSECDSMESLQSLQPVGGGRAPPRLLHQAPPARLNRSNSIRSTKSEKLYPSMLQRSSEGEYEPYYCLPVHYGDPQGLPYGASEPPSPSPRSALSPPPVPQIIHPPLLLPSSSAHSSRHSHHYKTKNDDAHGSTASLVSTASSLHSSAEERQAHEARKLRRELADAKDKVHTLTTQLTTNAHVVSAFEQSLSNMTQRLQQLTATAERKDSELTQLRQTIELLRKQSIQAGLTSAHMTSMGIKQDTVAGPGSILKQDEKQHNGSGSQTNSNGSNMTRHLSTDSVSSLNSLSSGCSSAQDKKHKKKGWLRSSFTKAFSRNAKISKTSKHSSLSHLSSSSSQDRASVSGDHPIIREGSNENSIDGSREILAETSIGERRHHMDGAEKQDGLSSIAINGNSSNDGTDNSQCDPQLVDDLKKQLREKDLVLTDIRLEALSSAHQLESLKDTVIKMRNEMLNLKQNNERLQRLVRPRSLGGSHVSLGGTSGGNSSQAQSAGNGQGNHSHSQQNNNNCSSAQSEGDSANARRFSAADAHRTDSQESNGHSQPNRELDFECATSTPTSHGYLHNKMAESPLDQHSDLYSRISRNDDNNGDMDDLDDDGQLDIDEQDRMEELRHCHAMGLLTNGSVLDEDPLLLTTGRLSGVDCDMSSSVLAPPKCRELAMGETYADLGLTENSADIRDGKKIAIAVYLGQPDTFPRYFEEVCETLNSCEARFYSNRSSAAFPQHQEHPDLNPPSRTSMQSPDRELYQNITTGSKSNTNSLKSNKSSHNNSNTNVVIEHGPNHTAVNCNEFVVAYTYISGKTTWQNLDYTVRKTFKDYLSRIDPGTNLGLNTDSITSYHLGDATRGPEIGFPELLPCGYIIGTVKTLYICLQGVGSLAFDSLIPKNIVYRYVSLLSEHRRVILCGPSGTGKSYLAARLAEFHVARTASHLNPAEAIATFNVEHKSSKELRQYLSNMAEQCGETEAALPSVLILDNLHHASALADVFSGLLGARRTTLPCIIGTMSQATCNTTNLQLHHNFRWLLTANHMEPVKGFLARYLRRKQLVAELGGAARCPRLSTVLEWLPSVWQHVNSFLEAHSSSDVTVGPRLFLGCPLELAASQAWFTSVWNFSVIPYLIEAAREGVALYGRRGAWSDPVKHVRDTYPWSDPVAAQNLRGISLEDIGLDGNSNDNSATNNQDPLLNMLMRLQEAANYSGNHSQDSDNASLDSNLTHDSSVGNEL